MRREYKIVDEAGLHARPASLLVKEATKFENEIMIEFQDKKMTLKSIMAVMSLGVPRNSMIAIQVDGDDQEEVFNALEKVLVEQALI
ncbi:MAG: HPr family phosphocarrier protein [Candidatus Izimaplasma sp.]|nr:HPr family phosphocarrier protein [Candidatus Izimaplasma bacterium]